MRLFLALEPPPELRARLGALADIARARCGGRRVSDASLHLTLAFLGEVEAAQAEALVAWLQGETPAGGEWHLDCWGAFRRPGIVWVGGRTPDPALTALQARLWDGLERLGHGGRPSRFMPHVTLLRRSRHLSTEALPPVELAWRWRRLTLLRSFTLDDGPRYEVLARSA
ncbi:RNA 2',3'-cyclic phosphodiesterase [Halomonas sp. H10-9-1]|uniref:RNA 2',3'-cyclic phosphodiesterase n=1 Tax=Halomonas sp. H10-9-1 TaxID=2950871 RepID=UPI0032E01881